jgi:hypothetical protein
VSVSHIPAALRRLVVERAGGLCEYCLIHEEDTFVGLQIDHICSEKHGGATVAENLAYSCLYCNRNKGSDIASMVPGTPNLVRFFNPRVDHWNEHFRLGQDGITLVALTQIGEATLRIFRINDGERLLERYTLREHGLYPRPAAGRRLER